MVETLKVGPYSLNLLLLPAGPLPEAVKGANGEETGVAPRCLPLQENGFLLRIEPGRCYGVMMDGRGVAWRAFFDWLSRTSAWGPGVGCALLALAGVVACGDGPVEVSREPQDWCNALVALDARCGFSVWGSVGECLNSTSDYVRRVNLRLLGLEMECLRRSECEPGIDEIHHACVEESRPQLEPTDASRGFCSAMGPHFFNCGYPAAGDSCAQYFASWSAMVLEQAQGCADGPCEELDSCLDQAFGSAK